VATLAAVELRERTAPFGFVVDIGQRVQGLVDPTNVRGIELNEYAAELARITIWINAPHGSQKISQIRWRKEPETK